VAALLNASNGTATECQPYKLEPSSNDVIGLTAELDSTILVPDNQVQSSSLIASAPVTAFALLTPDVFVIRGSEANMRAATSSPRPFHLLRLLKGVQTSHAKR
jgi:hypothetical protein